MPGRSLWTMPFPWLSSNRCGTRAATSMWVGRFFSVVFMQIWTISARGGGGISPKVVVKRKGSVPPKIPSKKFSFWKMIPENVAQISGFISWSIEVAMELKDPAFDSRVFSVWKRWGLVDSNVSNKKKPPRYIYRGWNPTQLCGDDDGDYNAPL